MTFKFPLLTILQHNEFQILTSEYTAPFFLTTKLHRHYPSSDLYLFYTKHAHRLVTTIGIREVVEGWGYPMTHPRSLLNFITWPHSYSYSYGFANTDVLQSILHPFMNISLSVNKLLLLLVLFLWLFYFTNREIFLPILYVWEHVTVMISRLGSYSRDTVCQHTRYTI
jgi:hypothetical protein